MQHLEVSCAVRRFLVVRL